MKLIPLTQDKFAQVDDEDFDYLMQFKWCANKLGNTYYAVNRSIKDKSILMHRVILGLTDSNILCDHKDHNGLNNQRINLRPCTHSENRANRKAYGSSKYLGVYFYTKKNKWVAQITKDSKMKHIGIYSTEIEAALAYNNAAKDLHGEFANLNDVPCGN